MKLNGIIKKNARNFIKYLIVAVTVTLFYIFLLWLVIDVMRIPTFIGSTLVGITIFFTKFISYVLIKLIKGGFANFLKYGSINIFSTILNIVLVWFFIEILNISTIISSIIVVGGLFLGRFILFKKAKLIED